MSSSLSGFLWTNLLFLQKIQFPFRWLSVATILGVISLAVFFQQSVSATFQIVKKYSLILFLTAISIFNISQIMLPAGLLSQTDFSERLQNIHDGESFDCWWTIWSNKKAFEQKEKVLVENRSVKIDIWNPEQREFEINQGKSVSARISTFYYPHWQAIVNGEKTKIELNPDGTMSIPIPLETAKVSLSFQEPFAIKTAKMISATGWILLALASVFIGFDKYRNNLPSNK
jgi:hypothetical protein